MSTRQASAGSLFIAALLVAIATPPAMPIGSFVSAVSADEETRGTLSSPQKAAKGNRANADGNGGVEFAVRVDRERERQVALEYVARGSLPPGLARREALPPGLARQLRERGRLPRGIEKRLHPLPHSLEVELPALPPYHIRRIAGDDLLIIDVRANLLVAHIRAVFVR